MSNSVSTRVWRESGHTKTKLLLLVKIADNVSNDGVGFAGRKYLAKNVRISERQVQRLIDQVQETGELYVRPGNGRGNETLSLITIGLDQIAIKQRLIDYFEMSPFEAENVSLSIIQKGDIFKQQRETKTTIKGDIAKRKTRTTINQNTLTRIQENTKTPADIPQTPDPIPPLTPEVPDTSSAEPPVLKVVPKAPPKVPAKGSPAKQPRQYGDMFVLVNRYAFKAQQTTFFRDLTGKATKALLREYPELLPPEFICFAEDWKKKKGTPDFPSGEKSLPKSFGLWRQDQKGVKNAIVSRGLENLRGIRDSADNPDDPDGLNEVSRARAAGA